MNHFWINFTKGYQNKGPLVKVGVGDLKVFARKFVAIEKKNVQIDHSRPPNEGFPPAECAFEVLQTLEQLIGPPRGFHLDHAVDKPILLHIPDGGGLIKRGASENPVFPAAPEPIDSRLAVADFITEIGADADYGNISHRPDLPMDTRINHRDGRD